jgi:hypothetical protein
MHYQKFNGQDYISAEAVLMIEVQMQCDDRARRIPSLLRVALDQAKTLKNNIMMYL